MLFFEEKRRCCVFADRQLTADWLRARNARAATSLLAQRAERASVAIDTNRDIRHPEFCPRSHARADSGSRCGGAAAASPAAAPKISSARLISTSPANMPALITMRKDGMAMNAFVP